MMKTRLSAAELAHIEWISDRELERQLLTGLSRGAAFITCSEMGARIPCIPTKPAGSVFVWQNFGGCLTNAQVLADLIRYKPLSDVIIMGHEPCELIACDVSVGARASAEEHVLQQIAKVARILAKPTPPAHDVRLHGWLWSDERLLCFDPDKGTFVPALEV